MGYSAKIKIDKAYGRQDGACAIFMQVIIDRKKKRIDLDLKWPPNKFDEASFCRPRSANDEDYTDYNIIIRDALAKANKIHKTYRLRNQPLSLELFIREYRSDLDKDDFIKYYTQKSLWRYNKGLIKKQTWKNEHSTLEMLKKYLKSKTDSTSTLVPILPFHEINADFPVEFDSFMAKKGNDKNTRWGRHKNIGTYLSLARSKDKITFIDPYENFSNAIVMGKWKPLDLDEIKSLLVMYMDWKDKPLDLLPRKNGVYQEDNRKGLTLAEVRVLRRFLFMCNTSLRISDATAMTADNFKEYEMSVTPKKTEAHGTTVESVPLNDVAIQMLDDERADCKGQKLFSRFTSQYSNRILKRIQKKADIQTKIHHHVARYTFASLMDQAGANHTGLMAYMGLKKRDTLNKYVKTNKKIISQDIGKLNTMLKS